MTSIPATIYRIYRNNFKRYYPIKKILFLDFLWDFWNTHEIYSIFKKDMSILG